MNTPRQLDDLKFLKNPGNWPFKFFCPVRKDFHTLALISCFNGKFKIAEGVNIFSIADGIQEIKQEDWQETTPEEIIQNGWYVD